MGLRDKGVRSLASYQDAHPNEQIEDIDPTLIDELPQIRTEFDEEKEAEFAGILLKQGQQTPAIVRPHPEERGRYIVVFGHRRRRAAITNGTLLKVVVRDISAKDAWAIQWSENIDRQDLSPLEIGRAILRRQEELGSLNAVAEETGKSVAYLSKYRRYAEAFAADGAAHDLIESGLTDSVDTVTELYANQNRGEAGARQAAALVEKVKADPSLKVREAVRALTEELNEAEGKPRSKAKPQLPAPASHERTEEAPRTPAPAAAGSVSALLEQVYGKLIEDKNGTVRKAMNAIGEEGKEKIERGLKKFYARGHTTTDADYSTVVVANLIAGTFGHDGAGLFNMVAFMEGKLGEKDGFDLNTVLNKAKAHPEG